MGLPESHRSLACWPSTTYCDAYFLHHGGDANDGDADGCDAVDYLHGHYHQSCCFDVGTVFAFLKTASAESGTDAFMPDAVVLPLLVMGMMHQHSVDIVIVGHVQCPSL